MSPTSTEIQAGPTPGPWRVDERAGIYEHDILGPHGEEIAYVNASDGADDPTLYPYDANARLIAAAPDLLAACKAFLEAPLEIAGERTFFNAEREWLDLARAAIAKAEGAA